jgi:hypothetical protein
VGTPGHASQSAWKEKRAANSGKKIEKLKIRRAKDLARQEYELQGT